MSPTHKPSDRFHRNIPSSSSNLIRYHDDVIAFNHEHSGQNEGSQEDVDFSEVIAFNHEHNHEHSGQNEGNQEDVDFSEESLQSRSPTELSTEFLYQTTAIETVTDTYDSTTFVCGQLNNILTTVAGLDGELVCGQCEEVLIDQPFETPSKVQEQKQIDSDDPDTKEMVCVNSTVVIAMMQDLPSVLMNEAVVADVPADTSDISNSKLLDGDDRWPCLCW